MTSVDLYGIGKQAVEMAFAGGSLDPLLGCAIGKVAVVVDCRGPTRDNVQASIAVERDIADEWPILIDWVCQDRTRVVSNHSRDAIVDSGLNSIAVVETSDTRGDQTSGRESLGVPAAGLFQPRNVEGEFAVGVRVSCIVQVFVRKRVRDVGKGIQIRRVSEPVGERIQLRAID